MRLVLFVSAISRQGCPVARHLLERQIPARALIRSGGDRARGLASQGVEMAVGDMDNPLSLKHAMTGVRGVDSMQDYWSVGARQEMLQGRNMADASEEAGVEHFVYSPVGGSERDLGIAADVFTRVLSQPVKFRRLPMPVVKITVKHDKIGRPLPVNKWRLPELGQS
jgi:hypothetical protein